MSEKIGKTILIDTVASKCVDLGVSKKLTADIINETINTIKEYLENGTDVTITDFGSFKIQGVKARKGRNIQTREIINIPAHNRVKFVAGHNLAEAVKSQKKKKKK